MLNVFFTIDVEIWCNGWHNIDAKFANALKTEKICDFPQLPDIAPSTDPDADVKHLLNLHKEKLTKMNFAGVFLALIAIILIVISQTI